MTDNVEIPPGSGRIVDQDIEDELKDSYLTYSMSVIVQRALPDVRDGLKPSQRRILVAMRDLGLNPRAPTQKCAGIVGETMKSYHPHGDQAIYPTLVRLAQDFNTRYLLIEGQGNFGSIDGDPPAAMRYTEARMFETTMQILEDIDMDTVDYIPTYDNRKFEPTVLPSRFPNLLCNGSVGIAVGMATSMPPHNVREICTALRSVIEQPDISVDELIKHVPGPDFPTGAYICGRAGIRQAYRTGRGLIKVRSKYHIEENKKRSSIVFTELPYQESKTTIIEKIATTVKDGRIKGISDVRDESDHRIRLVIELKGDADPEVIVNQLFKFTSLQTTFSIINIALVRGRPQTLNLKELLVEYKRHRIEVIRRRTRYLLRKAEERAHIVEGLLKALDHIDEIIALIRSSTTAEDARDALMRRFDFSEAQAREILNMQLRRLTGLEREKLEQEMAELKKSIDHYRAILASERMVLDIILGDLAEIEAKFGDDRRTQFLEEAEDLNDEDLIEEHKVVVTISREGYIKRTALTTYRSQGRGGRGITGSSAKEGDYIKDLFVASTHDYILFFTNLGRVYWLKVYECPEMSRTSRGRALVNIVQLQSGERVTNQVCLPNFEGERFVVLATRSGVVKKTRLEAFSRPKKTGIIALGLREGDELIGADACGPGDEIILATRQGMAIRFREDDCRPMGRTATGVGGIQLREGDEVVDMVVANPKLESLTIFTACSNGFGKKTPLGEYRLQKRNGSGTINIRSTDRNGPVVGVKAVLDSDDIVLITRNGIIMRMSSTDLRAIGRATQGVRLISVKDDDQLISIERVVRDDEDVPEPAVEDASGHERGGATGERARRTEDDASGDDDGSGDLDPDEGEIEDEASLLDADDPDDTDESDSGDDADDE
jgi:DNA gyrase subunit A